MIEPKTEDAPQPVGSEQPMATPSDSSEPPNPTKIDKITALQDGIGKLFGSVISASNSHRTLFELELTCIFLVAALDR